MFRVSTDGRELFCHFPYAELPDFKQLVHREDRRWCPQRKLWILTCAGFDTLCHFAADELAPLPEAVLDVRFQPTAQAAPRVRMAGNGGHRD